MMPEGEMENEPMEAEPVLEIRKRSREEETVPSMLVYWLRLPKSDVPGVATLLK